ncbi:DNA recombination protein RmuC [Geminicoccus roseus]|uniref:DNA recombination protein RmuC n=1 Tax=Geminicoccus roseus TaxID=404900 RepID=UPI00041CBE62|nr:DNA recombination protein RmuC [Geminicoccus roseus]
MEIWIGLAAAFVAGLGAGFLLGRSDARSTSAGTRRVLAELDGRRSEETEALLDQVKLAFAELSREGEKRAADELARAVQTAFTVERTLQGHRSQAERAEFEARIQNVLGQVERLGELIRRIERERAESFSSLGGRVEQAFARAEKLAETTASLRDALVHARVRGQWGERMAEDLLRAMGLVENLHWVRQRQLDDGTRPDITFLLPDGRVLHMDVKFPFENWARLVEASDEEGRSRARAAFVRDVRGRIAEVAKRGWSRPEIGALPLALLFVPNEQVFAGMVTAEPLLVDEAIGKRVCLVGPASLFAVLALIRHAAEERRIADGLTGLLEALHGLDEGWRAHLQRLDRLGRRLEDSLRDWHELRGSKVPQLERLLRQIGDHGAQASAGRSDAQSEESGAKNSSSSLPGDTEPSTSNVTPS